MRSAVCDWGEKTSARSSITKNAQPPFGGVPYSIGRVSASTLSFVFVTGFFSFACELQGLFVVDNRPHPLVRCAYAPRDPPWLSRDAHRQRRAGPYRVRPGVFFLL